MIITLYQEDCKTKIQNYKKVHRMPKHTVVTPINKEIILFLKL